MSDLDNNLNDAAANDRPHAYCQHCGKPLTMETARTVGQSVYCEPCLEAKLAGEPAAGSGYTRVNAGPAYTAGSYGAGPAYGTDAYYRNQAAAGGLGVSGPPNPGLAFLLGLIPGVGAMYNEQYAKGLVHLVIFAMLVMFAHVSGIFGLFIAGWVFYMAIEAHHTARAKRDGTPLPNPFGLNDIGERMGFGTGWINGQGVASAVQDAAAAAGFRSPSGAGVPPYAPPPQPGATAGAAAGTAGATAGAASATSSASGSATAGWGAPVDAFPGARPYAQDWNQQAYQQNYPQGYPQHYGYTQTYAPYGAPPPPYTAGSTTAVPPPIMPLVTKNRFPVGAVWLIALGTLFLLGTEGIFSGLRGEAVVGFIVIALGVTVFVRRMTAFGGSVEDDGSGDYQYRLISAVRGSAWLILGGVLFLLDSFRILYWDRSWPLFVILAGVMMLLRRVAMPAPVYPPYSYAAPVVTPAPGAAAESDVTRLNLHPDVPASETDAQTGGR